MSVLICDLLSILLIDIFTTASDLTLPHILIYSRTLGPKHWIVIVTFACFIGHRRPEVQSNSSLDYVVHHKTLNHINFFQVFFYVKTSFGNKRRKNDEMLSKNIQLKIFGKKIFLCITKIYSCTERWFDFIYFIPKQNKIIT